MARSAVTAVLVAVGCLALLTPAPGRSAAPLQPLHAEARYFALPAMPLQAALDQFGRDTGLSGFYDAASVAGRRSAPVTGRYTADAALRLLLEHSGLIVHYTAPDAFVLEPAPPVQAAPRSSEAAYNALLQARVREIFCRDAQIANGDYRLALRFHVDASGRVEQPALLASTGDANRDAAVLAALARLRLERPPATVDEPFVMLVLPQSVAPWQCGTGAAGAHVHE